MSPVFIRYAKAAAALLLAAAMMIGGCSSPKPETVAVDFIQAVADGRYDRAITMLDVPEKMRQDAQQWQNSQDKLTAMLSHARDEFEKKGGVSSIEVVESVYLKPDRQGRECMRVRLQVVTREGEPTSDDVKLVLDGRQWRIIP